MQLSAIVQTQEVTGWSSLLAVQENLNGMKDVLKAWERDQFGSVRGELRLLRKRLEVVRRGSLGSGPSREERAIMRRLSEILAREEVMENNALVLIGSTRAIVTRDFFTRKRGREQEQ